MTKNIVDSVVDDTDDLAHSSKQESIGEKLSPRDVESSSQVIPPASLVGEQEASQVSVPEPDSKLDQRNTATNPGQASKPNLLGQPSEVNSTDRITVHETVTASNIEVMTENNEKKQRKRGKISRVLKKLGKFFKRPSSKHSSEFDVEANNGTGMKSSISLQDSEDLYVPPVYTYPALTSSTLDQIKDKVVTMTEAVAQELVNSEIKDEDMKAEAIRQVMTTINSDSMKKHIVNQVMDKAICDAEHVMKDVESNAIGAYLSLYMYQIGSFILNKDPHVDIAPELSDYIINIDSLRSITQKAVMSVAEEILYISLGWKKEAESRTEEYNTDDNESTPNEKQKIEGIDDEQNEEHNTKDADGGQNEDNKTKDVDVEQTEQPKTEDVDGRQNEKYKTEDVDDEQNERYMTEDVGGRQKEDYKTEDYVDKENEPMTSSSEAVPQEVPEVIKIV